MLFRLLEILQLNAIIYLKKVSLNFSWYFRYFLFCGLNSGEWSMVLNWRDWAINKVRALIYTSL